MCVKRWMYGLNRNKLLWRYLLPIWYNALAGCTLEQHNPMDSDAVDRPMFRSQVFITFSSEYRSYFSIELDTLRL